MKYVIDFDHTLLDTTKWVEQVKTDGRYGEHINKDIWQYYDVRDFLYADVLRWLTSKSKHSLFIVSAVTPGLGPEAEAFQREKIIGGGFSELVAEIVLMVGEKGETVAEIAKQFTPHEPIVFIDDTIAQCESVKAAIPHAHCFLMVRESDNKKTLVHNYFPIISNLNEVDGMMKRL